MDIRYMRKIQQVRGVKRMTGYGSREDENVLLNRTAEKGIPLTGSGTDQITKSKEISRDEGRNWFGWNRTFPDKTSKR